MPPLRRTSAFVLAVLLLLTVAAPALAKSSGGSSDCLNGGYVNFTRSDGTPFTNEASCTKYTRKGGELQPIISATVTIDYGLGGVWWHYGVAWSGLEPESLISVNFLYANGSIQTWALSAGSGEGSEPNSFPGLACTVEDGTESFALVGVSANAVIAGENEPTTFVLPMPAEHICPTQ